MLRHVILATSILVSFSSVVLADDVKNLENTKKNYLILYGGNSSWKNTSNSNEIESGTAGWGVGLTYGRTLEEYLQGLSFELDLSYRNNEIHGLNFSGNNMSADGNYLNIYNFGVNLKYKFNISQNFNLYGFAGPGLAYLELKESDPVRKIHLETNLMPTVQLGTGIGYNLNDSWELTLGYRYLFGLTDLEVEYNNKTLKDKYDSHMIYGGIIYKF